MNKDKIMVVAAALFCATGLSAAECARARWITGAALQTDSPILEKTFALKAAPKEAVLDIAVAGWCEISVNGKRINDWVMWPVVTDYLTRVPAFRLDVAKFLKAGENEIAVQMGNGWFNCQTKVGWGFDRALWIQTPTIRATLVADGVLAAVTDASWRARRSPIVFNQLRNGEFYDARLENSTNVVAATRVTYPPRGAVSYAERNPRPVRAFESFEPVAVVKTEDGRDRYDFGVNLTGWCEIEVEGEAGAKVEIDYNETYGKKGEPYWEIQQYVKSGKAQHDEYTLAGRAGGERWHPRFTYHGFRYAWVKTTGKVTVRAIRARFVHSDFRRVGTIDTDNAMFMKLQACMTQSYFSNFVGFPTDCPHREKNGWTGDAALAAETGLWNFDAGDSYRNFLGLALDSQLPNGQVSCILPTPRWFGFGWGTGPAWDNVIFELPWQLYRYEGDSSALAQSYDAQARYLAYVETQLNDEGLMDFGLGDWCAGAQPVTPAVVTSTGYYYQFLRRLAKAARLLGKTADAAVYEQKAETVRATFLKAFAKGNGRFGDGLPTTLATPVYFGLVTGEEAKRTVRELVAAVRRNGHTCTFGILGAKYVPRVLSDYGYQDDAFELFVQPREPGYAAIAAKGETTLWESFDGGGSHNHIMFGDFSAWGYEYPGGIRIDESAPGFRHVVLQPRVIRKASRFKVTRELPQGRLESGWTRNADGSVAYAASLPEGVTATLRLPGRPDETVTGEVRRTIPAADGEPSFMTRDDGVKVTDVPSWKPRMFEITRKFERNVFGLMQPTPADLKVECLSEDKAALDGRATVKRLRFTWGRCYDKGRFEATAVLPNRSGAAAAFLYVRETPVSATPAPSDDWPIDEIVRRGYATVAFDGSQLTPAGAKDAVAQRAWALRMLYDWAAKEPRIDEMTTGPVGCGKLDGVAALWAGSYEWRFYLCIAAQCGLDKSYVELAANNTPGLLYTCSAEAETPAEIAGDRALAEDVSPAWSIYSGLRGFGGNTDWHLRKGGLGLVREDWRKFMDFTDRHGWALGDTQRPADSVPPLLTTYDGKRTVSTKDEWEAVRRPEIVKFFAEKVYGVAPAKPSDLRFERTAPDCEMTLAGGTRVVRKLLKATWTAPLGKGGFPFQAYVPKRADKVPAVLFLSLSKARMDPDRKVPNHNWDVEQICARGYAAVGVYYGDISPDRAHDFDVPPFNLYAKPADRQPTDWCAISAWAWGMSRVMDWIETEPLIDAKRVIAGGHSRGGKTALWAGVTDTRFAMAVPFGSGRTGMMLNHIKTPFPTETIGLINQQPHWFTPWYKTLHDREFETTFDHHQLAACVAPRLLFVCEGTGDMSRYGDWYSLALASPAWGLYGLKGLEPGPMPAVAQPAWADGQGFFIRFGPHAVLEEDWKAVLDFADKRLK